MLRKFILYSLSILFVYLKLNAQSSDLPYPEIITPTLGIKTNVLYDVSTTFNMGAEFKIASRWTLDVSANYNPWTFSGNRKLKHIGLQPEFRYWICEPYNKHFLGIHGHYYYYNAGNIKLPFELYPSLDKYRYQGWLTGVGFSYGYQWYLSTRWNLEANFGFGYAYGRYHRYECHTCGEYIATEHKHYFGPTKMALSLIYLIR